MRFLTPLFSVLLVTACSASPAEQPVDETSSEVSTKAHGLLGTDVIHYAPGQPNVARELAASVGASFVKNGVTTVPSVLKASSSTSPYAYAATLELSSWTMIGTTSYGSVTGNELFVRLEGAPAHKLFDAMTNAAQTTESDAAVRRSAKNSVVCARYTGFDQCFLGPLGNVESR